MKRLSILLLTLLSLQPLLSQAQTRGFSRDPEVFIDELGKHVGQIKNEQVNASFEQLAERWKAGAFSEMQQITVMKISEYMLIKKFNIDPDYFMLIKTLNAAKDSSISNVKFDSWIQPAYKLLQKDQDGFRNLLRFSENMFRENVLYMDDSKKWIFTENDYKFNFKNDRVTVTMERIDLKCQGLEDYMMIYGTAGEYDLKENTWTGDKGRVTWDRVGLPTNKVHADFGTFTIDLSQSEYQIKEVKFEYKGLLDGVLTGTLTDKISSGQTSRNRQDFSASDYPRFESDSYDLTLATFSDGKAKYKGGFRLHGDNVQGLGTKDYPAQFEFYFEDRLTLLAKSKNFGIDSNSVMALESEVTIFTDSGTIYHPMIKFNYLIDKNVLILTRGDKGIEQSPFFDSDHNLEIKVDQIVWELDKPVIGFKMLVPDDKAQFASKNFYREFDYERIRMGMMSYHPLTKMQQYCMQNRTKKFTLSDYAYGIGSKKEYLFQQMYLLADNGFIYYDEETDTIRVKEKLFNYVKNRYRLADYDVIRFTSVIGKKPNAVLNLVNFDLKVEGVRAFRFSDSQNVLVIPNEQQLTVKNDRRIQFAGRITAGRFDFYGKNFDFHYDQFIVSSQQIDSMKLFYPDTLNDNFLIPIKSVLRDLQGTLYIDKSNNKSGLTDYPEYPKFESTGPSLIAYDKKGIFDGAYKKDIFRFEVDPFTIDSMDNFTIQGLKFPGTFVSGGILPEFKYDAYIMKDYSLGFERANPPGGYPMYGGKGHGDIDISMSEEGFWAKGEIQYEGASMKSNSIVMMPDSTNATVESYTIEENSKYPNLTALDVKTHWTPKSDSMNIYTDGHPVDVFRDGQTFTGNLVHTPSRLTGGGQLDFENARLTSKEVVFSPNKADADTALITIGDIDAELISFASNNVKAHVDFDQRTGDFTANELGNLTEFPLNMFASSMDKYHWDMDAETIELSKTGRLKDEESFFVSRDPEQGGLKFNSTKALFDMKEAIIYAEEIPYIDIADSRLFPDEGKAVIEKEANIRPFENAKFLAARDNKYHELYECTIKVHGKYNIGGEGKYKYKDKHSTEQVIFFNKMVVNRDTTVRAEGYIKDSTGFTVSPMFAYKGGVELNSNEEFLYFKGFAKPLHTFKMYPSTWFQYEDRPDPKNVIFDVSKPLDKDRKQLGAALSISPMDSINVYPSMVGYKKSWTDPNITLDTGILFYDESSSTFYCGNADRLLNGAPNGDILSYNESSRIIESKGRLQLGLDLDKNFTASTAGKVSKHEDDTTFMIDAMMGLTINLPDECYTRILEVIKANSDGATDADIDNAFVKESISEFIDEKKYKKVKDDIESFGEIQFPPLTEFSPNILFSHMQFYYSWPQNAFVSYSPVSIANINNEVVNKEFNSRLMIQQRRSGTRIVLYIEVTKYDWFYFEYYRGNLMVYSTDKEFNQAIIEKGRKLSGNGYVIRPASPRSVTRMMDQMDSFR